MTDEQAKRIAEHEDKTLYASTRERCGPIYREGLFRAHTREILDKGNDRAS